ncbi:HupE/UreJ family protein [Salipiger sp. P9]|uniref:HupE/UreJ family protein n=1 Tax=Salipiger pentaromativorans TaxID=2943193 RepID=UPI002158745D|nr:HupE/UreJ family protein [Salipiger pentaromativorans]MCR8550346.1 HupE/UreJ family protein [Salipiger pentaromativorans]
MKKLSLILAPALLTASPALAHLNPGEHGSFAAGFTHPVFGADHVLAMVSVGLWAALLGGRAIWMLPVSFVAAMCAGFLLALAGLMLPFVEPVILASVMVLGVAVALAARVPAGLGAAVVAVFALFHGYAHGTEIGGATALTYLGGFAVATALLHGAGLALGLVLSRWVSPALTRVAGGAVAIVGAALAVG